MKMTRVTTLSRLLKRTLTIEPTTTAAETATSATSAVTVPSLTPPAIPRPIGLPLVGTLLDFLRNGSVANIHNYSMKRHAELGPIYAERMGAVDAVFVADPGLVRDIFRREGRYPKHMIPENWLIYNRKFGKKRGLFFMDGQEWWESRQVLNRLLSHPRMVSANFAQLSRVVDEALADIMHNSTKQRGSEVTVEDLEPVLYQWSVSFLSVFLFGEESGVCRVDKGEVEALIDSVREVFTQSAALTLIPPQLAATFNLHPWKKFVEAFEQALSITKKWVEHFMANGTSSGIIGQCLYEERMSRDSVQRIIIDLILAAADTTSFTTQWALFLLAKDQRVQSAVRQELLSSFSTASTSPSAVEESCLPKIPLLKGAVKEAMRLYPVAPFLTRYLPEDATVGGYLVPKDTLILISLYTMGRDVALFPDPLKFDPWRWLRHEGKSGVNGSPDHVCAHHHQRVTSYSFLPFGIGARSCVGRRLAEVNMYLLLSKFLLNYNLTPTNKSDVELTMRMVGVPSERIGLHMSPLEKP